MFATTVQACSKSNEQSLRYSHFLRSSTERITLYLLCFVLFVLCFCTVSFMYIYSYSFCLYWCQDYCHRVTNQLQQMMMMMIIIIIISASFVVQCCCLTPDGTVDVLAQAVRPRGQCAVCHQVPQPLRDAHQPQVGVRPGAAHQHSESYPAWQSDHISKHNLQ